MSQSAKRRGAWAALASLLLFAACTSGGSDGGSNTNWWECRVDRDCQGHEKCVAERCTAVDGSGASTGRLQIDASPWDSGVCVGEAYRSEMEPVDRSLLDVYLMVDQSSSMSDVTDGGSSGWAGLVSGLTAFTQDARLAGMAAGIQYFPLNGREPASCTAGYGTPDVEIATLPANSSALTASIAAHSPGGFTPTGPALTGAIDHMKTWAGAHPGRVPVVVLVTDGFPTECQPQQIADIAAVARTAATTEPRVRTFVIGVNLGASGTNLDQIAEAGGTHAAFLLTSSNLATDLTTGMLSIRVSPLQCVFSLPPLADAGAFDRSRVALRRIPKTGAPEDLTSVASAEDCATHGDQGFYFDPPDAPTRVVACPGTCASGDTSTLELLVHCPPVDHPPSR